MAAGHGPGEPGLLVQADEGGGGLAAGLGVGVVVFEGGDEALDGVGEDGVEGERRAFGGDGASGVDLGEGLRRVEEVVELAEGEGVLLGELVEGEGEAAVVEDDVLDLGEGWDGGGG